MQGANPDMFKTFEQLVEDSGYLFEEHTVTTADNYVLKVFRIPGMSDRTLERGKHLKPVVLL